MKDPMIRADRVWVGGTFWGWQLTVRVGGVVVERVKVAKGQPLVGRRLALEAKRSELKAKYGG